MRQTADLEQALDHIGAYVYIKDTAGRYRFANQRVRELFGIGLEQIVGKRDDSFFSPETAEAIFQNDAQVLRDGLTLEREERNRVLGEAFDRVYWSVKQPLYDADGRISGLLGVSTDITERKRMEAALREKEQLLTTVLDNVGAFIYMKSADYRYLYVNPLAASVFNQPAEQIIGRRDEELGPPEQVAHFRELDEQVFQRGETMSGIEHVTLPSGELRYFLSVKVPLRNEAGDLYAFLGMSTDITERQRLENELLRLATTDELTQLDNRRRFFQRGEQAVAHAARYGEPLSLMMVDIDHFKPINDEFGHATGDLVIRQVANILRLTVREADTVGRLGGEEFALLLPQTPLESAMQLAERLRADVAASNLPELAGRTISISIGVAPHQPDDSLTRLLRRADISLYAAKHEGRNCVRAVLDS